MRLQYRLSKVSLRTTVLLFSSILLTVIILEEIVANQYMTERVLKRVNKDVTKTRLQGDGLKTHKIVTVTSGKICKDRGQACEDKAALQSLAMRNWELFSDIIIYFVDTKEECGFVRPSVECLEHQCNEVGERVPDIPCLLTKSQMLVSVNDILVFTNDDILFDGLGETLNSLERHDAFFMSGRRSVPSTQMHPKELLNAFRDSFPPKLDLIEWKESTNCELDYFVLKVGTDMFQRFPRFVFGNWRWDNSLMDFLLIHNQTGIDTSKTVKAFHIASSSSAQENRPYAAYNDKQMRHYFASTASRAIQNQENIFGGKFPHNVIRYGSLDYIHTQTVLSTTKGIQTNQKEQFRPSTC